MSGLFKLWSRSKFERRFRRTKQQLVIIEPALKEAGGHHAGLAEIVARAKHARPARTLVVTHAQLNTQTEEQLVKSGCQVYKHFSRDFYRVTSDRLTVEERLLEIDGLADQLESALRELPSADCDVTLFYPSFGLEHLAALASACHRGPDRRIRHLVCLMFGPGVSTLETLDDLNRRGEFADKFGKLKAQDVRLFASDWELARAYSSICSSATPMPIHPFYLVNGGRVRGVRRWRFRKKLRIMLFSGDSRLEKGFDRVPSIARSLLENYRLNVELIVQYTNSWGNREVGGVEDELRDLADGEPRLTVHDRYWSDSEVKRWMSRLDLFILAHRADAYAAKSSGLLWLAGYFRTPLLFLERSWLTREAERLALPVVSEHATLDDLKTLAPEAIPAAAAQGRTIPAYRAELYRPFWPWLRNQMLNT